MTNCEQFVEWLSWWLHGSPTYGYGANNVLFVQQPTGGVGVNKIPCSPKLQVCTGDDSPRGLQIWIAQQRSGCIFQFTKLVYYHPFLVLWCCCRSWFRCQLEGMVGLLQDCAATQWWGWGSPFPPLLLPKKRGGGRVMEIEHNTWLDTKSYLGALYFSTCLNDKKHD